MISSKHIKYSAIHKDALKCWDKSKPQKFMIFTNLKIAVSPLSENSKKQGKHFLFWNLKIQMSSDDNEFNAGIDDVITKEECQKLMADALK